MKDNDSKEGANQTSRRDLLRFASITSLGVGLSHAAAQPKQAAGTTAKTVAGMKFEPRDKVRVGFVGVGGRGNSLLGNFSAVENVQVVALCDIVQEKCVRGQATVAKRGQTQPVEIYAGSDHAFEALAKRDDIDLVIVATSWDFHVPVSTFAMKQGKHVGVEVPAARTMEDCWDLVNTSEKTRRHCVQLENCCYGYNEMLVNRMVHAGVFGELMHGGASYQHDLRSLLFANQGEGLWRRNEHLKRNGNLYPTHGLGPVAFYMDINRGDRFESMVSMSSMSTSLASYRDAHLPADDPRRKETYACGDQNTSLIKTAKGRMIRLEHNVTSPTPYDRINLIAGTKGMFKDYPPLVYIDGKGPETWSPIDSFKQEFAPPVWAKMGEIAAKLGGHGGMDFIECYRLVQCMREGTQPDIDVYDAAAWSAPGPLSEASIAKGSSAVPFPDFTRGQWKAARA
jgi:predicted dehydrogenase